MLIVVAEHLCTDAVQTEVGHCHIRRFCKSSVQTHVIRLQDLSAQWVGQYFRHDADPEYPVGDSTIVPQEKEDVARSRTRSGGALRAFCHQVASNKLDEVAATYRALDRGSAEFQTFADQGVLATERAREGFHDGTAFGPKRRNIQRESARILTQARVQATCGDTDQSHCDTITNLLHDAKTTGQPLADIVSMTRNLHF